MIRATLVVAAGALAASACTDLTTLGVCGNGVVEQNIGEDCDGEGESCVACRLVCEPASDHPDASCPTGFACGKDAICRKASGYFALPPRLVDVPGDSLAVADFDYDGYADLLGFGDHGVGVVYGSEQLDLARSDAFPAPAPVHVDSQVAILRGGVGEDIPVHDIFVGAAIPVRIGIAAAIDIAGQLLAIPVPGLFVTVDTVDLQTIALFDQIILLSAPAGTLLREQESEWTIISEYDDFVATQRFGWDLPGYWTPGTYRLVILVDGVIFAQRPFTIEV